MRYTKWSASQRISMMIQHDIHRATRDHVHALSQDASDRYAGIEPNTWNIHQEIYNAQFVVNRH